MVLVVLRMFVLYLRIQDHHIVHLSDSFISDLKKEPFYKEVRELCDRLANQDVYKRQLLYNSLLYRETPELKEYTLRFITYSYYIFWLTVK